MSTFPLAMLGHAARNVGDGGLADSDLADSDLADSDLAVAIMDSLKSGLVGLLTEKGYSENLISLVNELESG